MNLSDICGKCRDFEDVDSHGFGHCRAFGGHQYKGNHMPCFEVKERADMRTRCLSLAGKVPRAARKGRATMIDTSAIQRALREKQEIENRAWQKMEDQIGSLKETLARKSEKLQELENALCEAEARSLLNFQRLKAMMDEAQAEGDLVWARTHDWDACHEEEKQDRMARARKWLKAEGKL